MGPSTQKRSETACSDAMKRGLDNMQAQGAPQLMQGSANAWGRSEETMQSVQVNKRVDARLQLQDMAFEACIVV